MAALSAAVWAFVRAQRRARALILFVAGGASSLAVIVLFVLSQVRFPG